MTVVICVCDYWQTCCYFELLCDRNRNNAFELHQLGTLKKSTKNKQWNKRTLDRTFDTGSASALAPQEVQLNHEQQQHLISADVDDSCSRTPGGNKVRRLHQIIDAISFHYLLRELHEQRCYRSLLANCMLQKSVQLLWLQLVPPAKDIIDYKFNHMIAHTIWEKVEVEYLMSWLSTLGGGYSALGEHFERCAETAGKISMKQLAIGMRVGDPFLQARCRLYLSISLIQRGQLRAAKHIIREQYKFAKSSTVIDERLIKMCQGIWLRLRYEYSKRLENRFRELKITNN